MRKIVGFFALMLMSSMAFASVEVHDRAGVISSGQQNALVASGSRWPFDLHVLTGTFASPAALESAVHRCVTGPNVVCIGIDPDHHKTVVHFGTATGISSASFSTIAAAGNTYFRSGNWQGGIEAIASAARDAVNAVPVRNTSTGSNYVVQQPVQVHIENPNTSTGWWIFAILMGVVGIVCIIAVVRARKTVKKINDDMNDFRDEAFEMSSRNMEERDFHEKLKSKMGASTTVKTTPAAPVSSVTPAPAPAHVISPVPATGGGTTVVHNHYGSNSNPGSGTLTGSVAGDVLLVNELTRPVTPVVVTPAPVVERVVEREVVKTADDGGSSSSWGSSSRGDDDDKDSGGSSSSWGSSSDSDSSSSSSWDSGSSSSWDSGSSSDWGGGGGGSDGGGGGSDW